MTTEEGLNAICECEGYADVEEMLEAVGLDSVVPAVCLDCGYVEGMEPDQDRGWCPECNANTLRGALVLLGVI